MQYQDANLKILYFSSFPKNCFANTVMWGFSLLGKSEKQYYAIYSATLPDSIM